MPCKVCQSKYRLLYEKKYVEDKYTYRQLEALAKEMGEKISKATFNRHFREGHHIENPIVKEKESISQSIKIIDEITENLKLLRDMISKMLQDESLFEDAKKIGALKNLLSEIRLSVKELFEMQKSLDIQPQASKEELIELVLFLVSDLDEKTLKQVKHKLEELMVYETRVRNLR